MTTEARQLTDHVSYDDIVRQLRTHDRFEAGGNTGNGWWVRITAHYHPDGHVTARQGDWIVQDGTAFEVRKAAPYNPVQVDSVRKAVRAHLATLTQHELIAAEHRAQIRIANAGQGLDRIAEHVRTGIHPRVSLDAARDELAAARDACGLVHEAQQVELHRRQRAEQEAAAEETDEDGDDNG